MQLQALLTKLLSDTKAKEADGFFLVECIVVIGLFAIIALGFASSMQFGLKMRLRANHRAIAAEIASDLLEEKTMADPASLVAGTTIDTYTWPNNTKMKFRRTQVVTVGSDGSRAVTVTVTDLNSKIKGSVQLSNTLVPWGSQ